MEWYGYVLMAVTCLVAFLLSFLALRKGWVNADWLSNVKTQLDELHTNLVSDGDESLVDKLVYYAGLAVGAVEQMARAGMISKEERKAKAMSIVKQYADLDGIVLDGQDMNAVDSLVEAAVLELPHEIKEAPIREESTEKTVEISDTVDWDDLTDEQARELLPQTGVPPELVADCKDRAALDALVEGYALPAIPAKE